MATIPNNPGVMPKGYGRGFFWHFRAARGASTVEPSPYIFRIVQTSLVEVLQSTSISERVDSPPRS
ncbi:hypothetical protein M2282_005487, partial [Variovorax boronicumulans]|uniref:hypothetical protein n=1 Tax=Variovorax boronicumulans TaxID=436515 RepID=UPI002475D995